jgi:hypothetical protein
MHSLIIVCGLLIGCILAFVTIKAILRLFRSPERDQKVDARFFEEGISGPGQPDQEDDEGAIGQARVRNLEDLPFFIVGRPLAQKVT